MTDTDTTYTPPDTPDDDDQPDEWDKRIINTGCAEENLKLQLCHYDTNDWRKCTQEMDAFRKCWASHNNNERTHTIDNDPASTSL